MGIQLSCKVPGVGGMGSGVCTAPVEQAGVWRAARRVFLKLTPTPEPAGEALGERTPENQFSFT